MAQSPLFILYGSATGNAEHIAKDLAATYSSLLNNPDADTLFPSVVCCELDQFKRQCQKIWDVAPATAGTKHGVVIVTSTTGNADPPENAGRFLRFVKRKTTVATQPFQHCTFAVLALGDTNYDQFCYTGCVVDKKLEELGGKRFQKVACADEAVGLEDVVEPWTASILSNVTAACRAGGGGGSAPAPEAVPKASPKPVAAPIPVVKKAPVEEEKKVDHADDVVAAPAAPAPTTPAASSAVTEPAAAAAAAPVTKANGSTGVKTVRSLLKADASKPIWDVDAKTLPGLGTSLSSCELVHAGDDGGGDDDDAAAETIDARARAESISTTSSAGFHYTIKRPFESTVLKARYLTETSIDAARTVSETIGANKLESAGASLSKAHEIYDKQFPLSGLDNAEMEKNAKRVLELTLSLPDDYTLEYAPGDSLGLLVENTPDAVAFLLDMLQERQGIAPDQQISIDSNEPVTVEQAIRTSIDLCSPIKNRRTLHSLSQFASEPDEECSLQLLASKTAKGEELFQEYVDKQRLSVVDLLREFPSLQTIPLNGLLSILPGIPPRYYSVSSSPIEHQRLSLTVAFSVVDYVTPSLVVDSQERGLRRVRGIATRYMEAACSAFLAGADAASAPALQIFPKPTADFRMPNSLSTPLVLIGPGTGVAPFMGFLSHRKALLTSSESTEAAQTVVEGTWRGGYDLQENELPVSQHDASGLKLGVDYRTTQSVGSVDVFFGCRHKDHDWLYRSEMQALETEGVISQLFTAFSRDGNRQYVQDIMRGDAAARLVELIMDKQAGVYVCGDGNAMAKDVQAAIVELLSTRLGGVDESKAYLEKMKTDKRFLMDIWS